MLKIKRVRIVRTLTYSLALISLLVACAGQPEGQPDENVGSAREAREEGIPLDPTVSYGRLDNGLTYYVKKNGKPAGRLQLRLVVNAGSVLERKNERGLAHFVEHMAFNGTESYDENSIVDYLERIGMSFGPDVNAYTSFDETVYSLDLPTEKPETVKKGFDILGEWAFRIAFSPDEVEKERGVIVEEWRSGRGASARLRDEWWPVLAEGSRYAQRLPIGLMDIVRNAPPSRLEGFYERWYRPGLMAVVAVGDMEPEEAVDLIERHFGGQVENIEQTGRNGQDGTNEQAGHSNAAERPSYSLPAPDSRRVVVATDPEASNIRVRLFGLQPSFVPRTEAEYRRSLALDLYRSMVSTRLNELTEQEDPPFINGYFSRGALVRSEDVSVWGATAYEGEVEKALRTVAQEARRVELFGFTEGELKRAKAELRRRVERAYKEKSKTNSSRFVSELVRHYLTGEASPGIDREWEMVKRMLPEITVETMERIHEEYIRTEHKVVVVTGPEKDDLSYPSEKRIGEILDEVETSKVSPYSDDFEGTSLIGEQPEAGSILREEQIKNGDFTRLQLSNGATVIYKKTELKNDQILFSAFSEGGSSLVDTQDYYAARLAPNLVGACGLGDFSPVQLEKLLSGTQAQVSPSVRRHSEGFSGSAAPEDFELLFQQLHLYHSDLNRNESLFESYKNRLSSAIKNRRSRPAVRYQDEISRILFGDHPRVQPLTSERVEAVDMERTFEIFEERFTGAGDFTYLFVGNIAEDTLRKYAKTYIASLPSGEEESWKDRGVAFSDEPQRSEVYAGREPKSRVTLLYTGPYEWSLERNHALSSLSYVLQIRLREAVREEAGGSYGVSVSTSTNRVPESEYVLVISFSCDPERVEELISIVETELEYVRSNELEKSYAEKVREKQRSDWEEAQQENSYWLKLLKTSERWDIPMKELLARDERIARVDVGMLRSAGEAFLSGAARLRVVLYPEDYRSAEDGESGP